MLESEPRNGLCTGYNDHVDFIHRLDKHNLPHFGDVGTAAASASASVFRPFAFRLGEEHIDDPLLRGSVISLKILSGYLLVMLSPVAPSTMLSPIVESEACVLAGPATKGDGYRY
jgi:hypothetical protein